MKTEKGYIKITEDEYKICQLYMYIVIKYGTHSTFFIILIKILILMGLQKGQFSNITCLSNVQWKAEKYNMCLYEV